MGEESSPRKIKKVAHQVLTERDVLPKLWDADKAIANGSYSTFATEPFSAHLLCKHLTIGFSLLRSIQNCLVECGGLAWAFKESTASIGRPCGEA
jgi:hypothetical protein